MSGVGCLNTYDVIDKSALLKIESFSIMLQDRKAWTNQAEIRTGGLPLSVLLLARAALGEGVLRYGACLLLLLMTHSSHY